MTTTRTIMRIADIFGDLPDLETERLLLRRLTLSDAPDVFEYAQDPEVSRHTTWEPHTSIENSRRFITWMLERYSLGQPADWGLVYKPDNKLVGTCGFADWVPFHARAEVGYAMSRRYWGQGIMTEAVEAMIEFGFTNMGLNRIEASCFPENEASARVMEKNGMQFEGILREHLYARGRYNDLKMYSILKRDWAVARSCAGF